MDTEPNQAISTSKIAGLTVAAIGVVYGDIGTSPLYTLRTCLTAHGNLAINNENVLGILSLIFWAVFIVVSCKYILVIMRANNKGEGGILALMALALSKVSPNTKKGVILMTIGVIGAALFYGDGIITPAISVLSAFEGVSIISHTLDPYIVPLTVIVLIALFSIQRHGTAKVGKMFGPIMIFWFLVLAFMGISSIAQNIGVLDAINPLYGVRFILDFPWRGFITMGAVILALTGGEALYVDMGHFGQKSIKIAWFCLVLPSLMLCYFGQGALLLRTPEAIKNPFFMLAPQWALPGLVILAAMATIIASQAVISGAFSMTHQAMQLGFCPRVTVMHTSAEEKGQIYIPQVNWFLMIAVILLVLVFKSSANFASAYGLAVCGTMTMTTLLAFNVLPRDKSQSVKIFFYVILTVFLSIDLIFLAANLSKFVEGGWIPLFLGFMFFTIMITWKRGRTLIGEKLHANDKPLQDFFDELETAPVTRVEGTAIFMTTSLNSIPYSFLHNVKHNKVLHEKIIFLTIRTAGEPTVARDEKVKLISLGHNFYQLVATYGFKEEATLPSILRLANKLDESFQFDLFSTSFFLSREIILIDGKRHSMPWWQRNLFSLMLKNTVRATSFFKIPPDRVVELGAQIEL